MPNPTPAPIPVVSPIVHLNGTSRGSLLAALEDAYLAVSNAMDTLRQCAPNGRDYYPDPGRMPKAEDQHRSRGEYLKAVLDSIEAEVAAIGFDGSKDNDEFYVPRQPAAE